MATYMCPTGQIVLLDDDVVLPGKVSMGSHGYAQVCGVIPGKTELLHRWLLGLTPGDKIIGDHINRNRMDCRRANLRAVDGTTSNLNRGVAARDLPLGVYRTPAGRYYAAVKRHRKIRYLGTYDTVQDAHDAVLAVT